MQSSRTATQAATELRRPTIRRPDRPTVLHPRRPARPNIRRSAIAESATAA